MSKDASLFPIHFFDCDIFCEICVQMKKFKVFSMEAYNKTYSKNEIPPNKPLYCKCEECGHSVIYATNEFAELQENANLGLCKIWGKGILTAGDQVFIESEGVCSVESVNRFLGEQASLVTLKKQSDEKFEAKADFFDKGICDFYRIIPQDIKNTRIGDMVYNTNAKLAGKAIGLQFNGCQSIIVKYETGELAKIDVSNDVCYLTDKVLGENAIWRCKDLPYFEHMHINSKSKVLIIDCMLPNFKAISELEKIMSSIPQARCFVMHVAMKNSILNSNDIYRELVKNCVCIYNCKVEYKNQDVFITGFYSDINVPKSVYKVLSRLPIKKINLDLKKRSDIKSCKTINGSDNFIRISKIDNKTHIDGWIKNERERRKAKFQAFLCNFSLRIEDHLFVMDNGRWLA